MSWLSDQYLTARDILTLDTETRVHRFFDAGDTRQEAGDRFVHGCDTQAVLGGLRYGLVAPVACGIVYCVAELASRHF